MADFTHDDDIIDSRDVIERFEELESEREALNEAVEDAFNSADNDTLAGLCDAQGRLIEWDEDNGDELRILRDFIAEGSDEWRHGETLIRYSHFEDYAQELAEEIGAPDNASNWPCTCIDWKRAARELAMDYSTADFDGIAYYYRS